MRILGLWLDFFVIVPLHRKSERSTTCEGRHSEFLCVDCTFMPPKLTRGMCMSEDPGIESGALILELGLSHPKIHATIACNKEIVNSLPQTLEASTDERTKQNKKRVESWTYRFGWGMTRVKSEKKNMLEKMEEKKLSPVHPFLMMVRYVFHGFPTDVLTNFGMAPNSHGLCKSPFLCAKMWKWSIYGWKRM